MRIAFGERMELITHRRRSTRLAGLLSLPVLLLCFPHHAAAQQQQPPASASGAQQNQPPAAQRAEAKVENAVRRWRIGVQGGVGLDPEILDVGVHAEFGPIFSRNIQFRPVFEIGAGEITTTVGINLDVLYSFPGATTDTRWMPYVGAGPNLGLSHKSVDVEAEGLDNNDNNNNNSDSDRNRFDFSDTDFNGGMNFIVGMRRQSGTFFEMKATAWGVSNIRLLVGFNF